MERIYCSKVLGFKDREIHRAIAEGKEHFREVYKSLADKIRCDLKTDNILLIDNSKVSADTTLVFQFPFNDDGFNRYSIYFDKGIRKLYIKPDYLNCNAMKLAKVLYRFDGLFNVFDVKYEMGVYMETGRLEFKLDQLVEAGILGKKGNQYFIVRSYANVQ